MGSALWRTATALRPDVCARALDPRHGCWDAHRFAYLAYRYGYGDNDEDEELFTTDERSIHTFTIGILPHRNLRVKLEYSHNELIHSARSDFNHWVVSVGGLF